MHQFRANSIYDPDYTGVGHQPYGRDQWVAFYNHYTVLGSKITVHFSATTTSTPTIVGIALRDEPSAPSTYEADHEAGRYTYAYLNTRDSGRAGVTLRKTYSMKKFFKVGAGAAQAGRRFLTLTGNNPNEDALFQVTVKGQDPGADPGNVLCHVTIDYIVLMTEPKELAAS